MIASANLSSTLYSNFRSSSNDNFYDIPSTRALRATSFGYGNKLDLGKRNFVTPPPDRYSLKSEFNNDGKHGKTLAQGRNDVKANDMFFRPLKQAPEPATYSPKPL